MKTIFWSLQKHLICLSDIQNRNIEATNPDSWVFLHKNEFLSISKSCKWAFMIKKRLLDIFGLFWLKLKKFWADQKSKIIFIYSRTVKKMETIKTIILRNSFVLNLEMSKQICICSYIERKTCLFFATYLHTASWRIPFFQYFGAYYLA